MVSIKNIGRRQLPIMLPHDVAEMRHSQAQKASAGGVMAIRRVTVQVANSITLAPGEVVTGLPDSMLTAADVIAGVAAKRLAVFSYTLDVADVEAEKKPSKPSRNKGK